MGNGSESLFSIVSDGGIAAKHPARPNRVIRVAPTTGSAVNVVTEELLPVACVRFDDVRFEFDSSFIGEAAAKELKNLDQLRSEIPGMPVTVFGHADPVGDDDYNKQLSGRRAQAMYALLTRKTALWDDLFLHPEGNDNWRWKAIQHMLTTLSFYDGEIHGKLDQATRKAISDFQEDPAGAGSKPDTEPFPKTRPKIYAAYMDAVCVKSSGKPFQLDPKADFLAHEADPKTGRGDYQGCSEFNPFRVFSKAEDQAFQKAADHTDRDKANQPNRRVLIYLFPPDTSVAPSKWPCPAAKQGVATCKEQFFKSDPKGDVRRKPQDERREYKDTLDTFACKFYDRLAVESPCERGGSSVQTRLVRVHLRLRYKDPDGKPHVFPPDFPVTVFFPASSTSDPPLKVDAYGKLTFTVDRSKFPIKLQFQTPGTQYVASSGPDTKGPGPERLVAQDQLSDVRSDHYRVFSLPQDLWSFDNSDWSDSSGKVIQIAAPGASEISIGSETQPVDLTLDPHWQFLQFKYFDRRLKKKLAVPLGELLLDGFLDSTSVDDAKPDTSSNWTTATPNECQCLPWIVRTVPKPDDKVLIQFKNDANTFIQALPDGSRQIVKGTAHNEPNAARLDFYDLPEIWKSRLYFGRLNATTADRFEKIAAQATTSAQPLAFSLDDIVLTDKDLAPVTWKPDTDRAAIFANTFSSGPNLSAIGLYKPDDTQPYFTKKPEIEKDKNYIVDYPDWTRLVIANGDLFDVFHKRTPERDGEVVGARAGVRWDLHANVNRCPQGKDLRPRPAPAPTPPAEFFVVESFFHQEHASHMTENSVQIDTIGRFDMAILRCCDAVGDLEKAVNLHYFRFTFDFSPPADTHFASTPNSIAPGQRSAFTNEVVQNIANRWNGKDDKSPDQAIIVPVDVARKLEARVTWFIQAIAQQNDAHFKMDIFDDVRAHMASTTGHGAIKEKDKEELKSVGPDGETKGWFTAAHETGHGDSLNDEYIEPVLNCSYFAPGFVDSIPGSPYAADEPAMMNSNLEPRPRHFWHIAEWLNTLYGFPFQVKLGSFTYSLPTNKDFTPRRQSFVNWPQDRAVNIETGIIPDSIGNKIGSGKYNSFLYPLGYEKYSTETLPHGASLPGGRAKGLLIVVVKMVCAFLDSNDFFEIKEGVSKIVAGVEKRFNTTNRFFFTSAAHAEISPCLIRFSPRIVVRNIVNNAALMKSMNLADGPAYQKKVQDLIRDEGAHFSIDLRDHGSTRWDSVIVPSPTGLGFVTDLRLEFNMDDANTLVTVFPRFFAQMVGVSGNNVGAPNANIDNAASYQALATKLVPDAVVQRMP